MNWTVEDKELRSTMLKEFQRLTAYHAQLKRTHAKLLGQRAHTWPAHQDIHGKSFELSNVELALECRKLDASIQELEADIILIKRLTNSTSYTEFLEVYEESRSQAVPVS